jgi:hypothetical protein
VQFFGEDSLGLCLRDFPMQFSGVVPAQAALHFGQGICFKALTANKPTAPQGFAYLRVSCLASKRRLSIRCSNCGRPATESA